MGTLEKDEGRTDYVLGKQLGVGHNTVIRASEFTLASFLVKLDDFGTFLTKSLVPLELNILGKRQNLTTTTK